MQMADRELLSALGNFSCRGNNCSSAEEFRRSRRVGQGDFSGGPLVPRDLWLSLFGRIDGGVSKNLISSILNFYLKRVERGD